MNTRSVKAMRDAINKLTRERDKARARADTAIHYGCRWVLQQYREALRGLVDAASAEDFAKALAKAREVLDGD
jgi:uncharacterized membrane protein YccC